MSLTSPPLIATLRSWLTASVDRDVGVIGSLFDAKPGAPGGAGVCRPPVHRRINASVKRAFRRGSHTSNGTNTESAAPTQARVAPQPPRKTVRTPQIAPLSLSRHRVVAREPGWWKVDCRGQGRGAVFLAPCSKCLPIARPLARSLPFPLSSTHSRVCDAAALFSTFSGAFVSHPNLPCWRSKHGRSEVEEFVSYSLAICHHHVNACRR